MTKKILCIIPILFWVCSINAQVSVIANKNVPIDKVNKSQLLIIFSEIKYGGMQNANFF
jgi:hypothetical protein